ncbi:NUDIX domain-containing protein [Halobacillus litoralis]|uniref:NUDIX domain-containing protein n=1 Tax=Halobacillus litoralis TaxID=45668 RepID=A0A845DN15_9BACI|nr:MULTISPECIES: NUDIX domain-containing protein [Halobacillus]MYL18806.1 NUDIX domain-containing protein [Halobacillus litoralis]MYL31254.1 NUDIX domain-containing protein [Halobacillus halophilus]
MADGSCISIKGQSSRVSNKGGVLVEPVWKVYGYITRFYKEKPQVLVFQHSVPEAGIQIPKGTVNPGEDPLHAVVREMVEETGLNSVYVEKLLAVDTWINEDGKPHKRCFYQLHTPEVKGSWLHEPSGGGEEKGLTFHFFWISSVEEVDLIRGHGDYLHLVLDGL